LFTELTTQIIVPPCTKWLANLPAYPIPHKKCCIPTTGSQLTESESSIVSQRPCGGRNLPRTCHMVIEWPKPHYTSSLIKSLSNQTVHSADSKQYITVVTPTQKDNKFKIKAKFCQLTL